MRVAILADIHGNLPACEAVLEDIDRMAPDYIVAAGDLALRGAHPRETVELLADRCDALLMGNTDCYLAGNYLGGAYRERDHWKTELLRWTRDQLGENHLKMLGSMPFSIRYTPRKGQDLFVCHANPKNLEESLDPTLDELSVRKFFMHLDAAACAFGHLHFPYRRRVGRMIIADVASAGIPRDGDLRPAYGIFTYTPKGWRVQIRRVRYPVRKATQALTARKVPGGPILIHKLVEARYRHHHALLEAARRHSGLPPPGPVLRPPPGAPPRAAPVEPAVAEEPPVPRDEAEAAALRQEAVDPTDLGHAQATAIAAEPALAAQLDAVNDLDG
ncbi:metallophosphoesterase family protein [Hyalangium versicolor]|uniref:metallophosphoesterase family protein n=1 Tax=Hyalangium versicolor TaxID=2861190 RepID=UPI001CCABE96|nr:metallophosphoesterase family protein [Hyalangium versicolor]